MNFKDAMKADTAVFLNPNEFGEPITIDGQPTVGIWDDTAKPFSNAQDLGGVSDVNTFGLLTDERVLYVPSAECGGIPTPLVDQRLDIDGEYWTVLPGTRAKHGVLEIKLLRVYS